MELVKRGSVKDIYKDGEKLFFNFSDRYSIFDWGEMPNLIPAKGDSLLSFALNTFSFLESKENWKEWDIKNEEMSKNYYYCKSLQEFRTHGLNTHLIGKKSVDGIDYLEVEPMNIPNVSFADGKWDYSKYQNNKLINTLIPLEVIFRFSIPEGSSFMSRAGDINYLKTLGLDSAPSVGDTFETPIIEVSTKLEEKDRYIDFETAQLISGMSSLEIENLKSKASLIALRLKDYFEDAGLELCDGKFEFAYGDFDGEGKRDIKLIDSIGPDELRLKKDGIQLSKEVLRRCYQNSKWVESLKIAKIKAKEENRIDWKKICINELGETPDSLKDSQIETVSQMYKGLNLALLNDTKVLDGCISRIKEL